MNYIKYELPITAFTLAAPKVLRQPLSGMTLAANNYLLGDIPAQPSKLSIVFQIARTAATMASAYHGYKRNNGSIKWAVGWTLVPPVIAIPLMLAQGFAQPERATSK